MYIKIPFSQSCGLSGTRKCVCRGRDKYSHFWWYLYITRCELLIVNRTKGMNGYLGNYKTIIQGKIMKEEECKHDLAPYNPRFWNDKATWFYCKKCLVVKKVYRDKGLTKEYK